MFFAGWQVESSFSNSNMRRRALLCFTCHGYLLEADIHLGTFFHLKGHKNCASDNSYHKYYGSTTLITHNACPLGAITWRTKPYSDSLGPLRLTLNSLENITLKNSVFRMFSVNLILFSLQDFVSSDCLITFFKIHRFCTALHSFFLFRMSTQTYSNVAKLVVRYFLALKPLIVAFHEQKKSS